MGISDANESMKRIKFMHESRRFGKENEFLNLEFDAAILFSCFKEYLGLVMERMKMGMVL